MSGDEETRRRRAASAPPTDEGLAELGAAMRDPSWRVRKAAASRVVEAFPASQVVGPLIELLGDASDVGARSAAAEALSLLGGKAVPSLVAAFAIGDGRVRKAVLDVVATAGLTSAAELLAAGLTDADPNVRMAAVETAARLHLPAGDRKAAGRGATVIDPALFVRALADPEFLVRFAVLTSLPEGSGVPVARIVEAAKDPLLRRAAIRALGRTGEPAAIEALGEWIAGTHDESWDEALVAIASHGERFPAAARAALVHAKLASIRERLSSTSARTAEAAAMALGLLGETGAAGDIAKLLAALPAKAALGGAGLRLLGAKGLAALAALSPPLEHAGLAAVALAWAGESRQPAGQARDATAVSALRSLFTQAQGAPAPAPIASKAHTHSVASFHFAAALARRGEADGVRVLVDALLVDLDGEFAEPARDALAALGSAGPVQGKAIAQAFAALEPPKADIARAAIAQALGSAGEAGVARLRALARDPAARVRRAALASLAAGPLSAQAFEEASAALQDEDGSVRTAALAALGAVSKGR